MKHNEYKRIEKDAHRAILFVHGIVGTPRQFDDFVELVDNKTSVYNILLDGHGKSVRDFSATSMKKWEAQVQKAVEELARLHNEIYIVAHSMGTLFAIEQAVKNPKITKLFLLAVPLKLFLKSGMFSNSLKVYFDKINPDDAVAIAAKRCYGIEHDKNIFNYFGWIPRYLELFKKISESSKTLESLRTPSVAFQSTKDEMVSVKTVGMLKQNPAISVFELKESGHYYYSKEDMELLINTFKSWLG